MDVVGIEEKIDILDIDRCRYLCQIEGNYAIAMVFMSNQLRILNYYLGFQFEDVDF